MIKFADVSKKFPDGTAALADINFECADGEFVFLVGPSGAGKTTFLRLILRDFLPSSGEITVGDWKLVKMKAGDIVRLRRDIGFVFQDLKLLWDRNVYENVALSLEILGEKEKKIKDDVREALELVGMGEHLGMFPAQLAGGELQRVALARALVGNPRYILADEPTGNVDPANSWAIIKILEKANKAGITIIMVTHNADIVDSLEKRVLRLENGRIVSDKKGAKYR